MDYYAQKFVQVTRRLMAKGLTEQDAKAAAKQIMNTAADVVVQEIRTGRPAELPIDKLCNNIKQVWR